MNILLNLLISAAAVFVASRILPGVRVDDYLTIFLVAIVLGAINAFVKPLLVLLTLPINIVTFGLFLFVINGLLVLAVSALVPGFFVENIWWAIAFSIVVSLVGGFLEKLRGH